MPRLTVRALATTLLATWAALLLLVLLRRWSAFIVHHADADDGADDRAASHAIDHAARPAAATPESPRGTHGRLSPSFIIAGATRCAHAAPTRGRGSCAESGTLCTHRVYACAVDHRRRKVWLDIADGVAASAPARRPTAQRRSARASRHAPPVRRRARGRAAKHAWLTTMGAPLRRPPLCRPRSAKGGKELRFFDSPMYRANVDAYLDHFAPRSVRHPTRCWHRAAPRLVLTQSFTS